MEMHLLLFLYIQIRRYLLDTDINFVAASLQFRSDCE